MGYESILYGIAFPILLGLSAFFSGSETAFFSLSQSVIQQFSGSSRSSEQRVARLMATPRQLLITIVLGNTIVNTITVSLAAILTMQICDALGFNREIAFLIDVVVVTLVLLITSEIIPKVFAVRNPQSYACIASGFIAIFFWSFKWLTAILTRFTKAIQSAIGFSDGGIRISETEFLTTVTIGEEVGTLEKEQKEMIHSIFEFRETQVKEIMIPRTDMVCVEVSYTLAQVMDLVKTKLLSRIPVYEDRIDNIIGILYVKDLLPLLGKGRKDRFSLKKLVRPPRFVPEQKMIDDLLREFQQDRYHMAIVVDEYGGVAGLVTLEDIIEEIVGEIQDEYDKETPLYKKVGEKTYLVDGRMPLEEVNGELNMNLPTEEGVETISGFILTLLGSLPKEKEIAHYNGYHFIVERTSKNRILQVRIQPETPEKPNVENSIISR